MALYIYGLFLLLCKVCGCPRAYVHAWGICMCAFVHVHTQFVVPVCMCVLCKISKQTSRVDLYSYGLYSNGVYSYGLYSYGLYSYGLHSLYRYPSKHREWTCCSRRCAAAAIDPWMLLMSLCVRAARIYVARPRAEPSREHWIEIVVLLVDLVNSQGPILAPGHPAYLCRGRTRAHSRCGTCGVQGLFPGAESGARRVLSGQVTGQRPAAICIVASFFF